MAIVILHRTRKIPSYAGWLRDLDEELILLARSTSQGAKEEDYDRIIRIDDFDSEEVEAVVYQLSQSVSIRQIVALAEEDIIRAGKMRDRLHISGQSEESAIAYRDKVDMKHRAVLGGVKCPAYNSLCTKDDLYQFIAENDYPVVVKPTDGFGSMRTYIIRSESECSECLAQIAEQMDQFMVEEFIQGEMYSINGLAIGKKIEFCSVNPYSQGCADYNNGVGQLIMTLPEDEALFARARELTQKVIEALPSPDVLIFHCEIFISGDELVFCEIASRPAGGWICEAVRHSYGVDLKKTFVQLTCGIDVPLPRSGPNRLTGILYIPTKEQMLVNQIEDMPFDWVKQYIPVVAPGTVCEAASDCVDIAGAYIYVAATYDELLNRANELREYSSSQLVWA